MNSKNLKEYFSGKKLYGDDFNPNQIKEWFEDEKEGYSGLIKDKKQKYECHQINKIYGYDRLKRVKKFKRVLSFGGSTGEELLPIIDRAEEIYIIEPSKKLRVKKIKGKPVKYITPQPNGKIKFKDNYFDLITCFSVLHHIPNLSDIFREFVRILRPGGFLLIREPIVSMGDWRKPRKGLTKRERGIPEKIFEELIRDSELKVIYRGKIMFPLLRRINLRELRGGNSKVMVYLDNLLSRAFSWNDRYHSTRFYHKLRPQSIFYVLKK